MKSNKEILEILERGVEEIIPEKDFRSLLESKKKLVIKAGFDPVSYTHLTLPTSDLV